MPTLRRRSSCEKSCWRRYYLSLMPFVKWNCNEMPSLKLFLGMTLSRRPDWERFLVEPQATRSKKPESVQAEIAEKRAQREENAQFWPLTGTISACVIIDQDGNEVFSSSAGFGTPEGDVSHKAMCALHALLPDNCHNLMYGIRIYDRMRVMALDAIRFYVANPKLDIVQPRLWSTQAFESGPWVDPYSTLVPSERRNDISWDCLCDFLGIAVPDNVELDADPRLQAEVARQLTIRSGLILL